MKRQNNVKITLKNDSKIIIKSGFTTISTPFRCHCNFLFRLDTNIEYFIISDNFERTPINLSTIPVLFY